MLDHSIEEAMATILMLSREKRGLSKNKLAEMAGLNQRSITYIETLRSSPSVNTLISITNAMGIKVSELMRAAEEGETDPL